jgi:hypothetical protein
VLVTCGSDSDKSNELKPRLVGINGCESRGELPYLLYLRLSIRDGDVQTVLP